MPAPGEGQGFSKGASARLRQGARLLDMREIPPAPPGLRGMRRHPALVELSRDHHHALVLARRLRLAADRPEDERSSVARDAEAFLRDELTAHFRTEEEVLLPRTRDVDEEGAQRILDEHREIREGFRRLGETAAPAGPLLLGLGQLLDDHVRFEERGYFERIQQGLDEPALEALTAAMAAATRGRSCPTG